MNWLTVRDGSTWTPGMVLSSSTTNGHNHAIDGVEAQVERVKHNLRKQARKEVTPIPSINNDALATNSEENEALATTFTPPL